MRTRAWALQCSLLLGLLHAARGEDPASSRGEWCRVWAFPGGVFRCPRQPDGADAQFCCGTCTLPYCCSSQADRLDQQLCPPGAGVTSKPRNNPPGSEKTSYGWTIFFSFVSFLVGMTSLLIVSYCKERYWLQLRTFWHDNVVQAWNRNRNQDEPREMSQMEICHLPDIPEPIPDPLLRPPPPNVTIMPVNPNNPQEKWAFSPSALVGFFHSASAENMEGETTAAGDLVHSQALDNPPIKETSL